MEKIYLISLGCPKNLVDSENIMAILGEKNYVLTDSAKDADIIIVNTCAFLKAAVMESKTAIKQLVSYKKHKSQKLVVCGCLVQRYGEKLFNIHGIDGIAGPGNPEKVAEVVELVKENSGVVSFTSASGLKNTGTPRLVSTYPYTYLKISEGCDNFCSYCLIPQLRGRLQSRKSTDIVREAKSLLAMGLKELILIAQDTTHYGWDKGDKNGLEQLLLQLVKTGFPWIRLMYAHPAHITEGLLEIIAREKNVCRYLDIPLQHIHPEILKKMNRPVIDYSRLIDNIRKTVPDIRLRTSFIVGFPGEKRQHFKHLLDFVKEKRFDRVGVFRYSREKGTPAYNLTGHLKEATKLKRERYLMDVQKKISEEKLKRLVGQKLRVLIEGIKGDYYTARTEFDAPEIDGMVYLKKNKKYRPGDFCTVTIVSSTVHDLFAIYP